MNKIDKKMLFSFLLFTASFLMCFAVYSTFTLIYMDDVIYAGWTKHGFGHFLEKNIWHYNNFNGRIIVHIALQAVLFFDKYLYVILMPIIISSVSLMIIKTVKPDWDLNERLIASSIPPLLLMSLSPRYLTTVIWASGAFNYIFPLILVITFYTLFLKYKDNKKAFFPLLMFAVICGSLTEQYSMYTLGLIVMTYFFEFIEGKKLEIKTSIFSLSTIPGLISILFAPPTLIKVLGSTNIQGEGKSFIDGVLNNFGFLSNENGVMVMPALFMMLTGLAYLSSVKERKIGLTSFFFGVLTLILSKAGCHGLSSLLIFIYVISLILFFFKTREKELFKFSVCGFGTFIMMSVTNYAGTRTCIPFIFTFMIILSLLLFERVVLAEEKKKKICISIIVIAILCSFVNYVDNYKNYKEESLWCKDMYEEYINAKDTGYIRYNIDDTLMTGPQDYRVNTIADGYRITHYQDKFDIPDNVKFLITSNIYDVANISYKGAYSQYPAIKKEEVMIPIMAQFWTEKGVLASKIYISEIKEEESYEITIDDKKVKCKKDEVFILDGKFLFVNIDVLCEQWNLEYSYDKEENTYRFKDK